MKKNLRIGRIFKGQDYQGFINNISRIADIFSHDYNPFLEYFENGRKTNFVENDTIEITLGNLL